MKQQITGIAQSIRHRFFETTFGVGGFDWGVRIAGELVQQGNCQQGDKCNGPHGAHPADALNEPLNNGCEYKLTKRSTCVNDA